MLLQRLPPQQLLSLSQCNHMLSMLVKYSEVLRSVMFCGSNSSWTSLTSIMNLIRKGQIHFPSPLRLLRLCLGKCCEKCIYRSIRKVRPQYGLFMCWNCTTDPSQSFKVVVRTKRDWYFTHAIDNNNLVARLERLVNGVYATPRLCQ